MAVYMTESYRREHLNWLATRYPPGRAHVVACKKRRRQERSESLFSVETALYDAMRLAQAYFHIEWYSFKKAGDNMIGETLDGRTVCAFTQNDGRYFRGYWVLWDGDGTPPLPAP